MTIDQKEIEIVSKSIQADNPGMSIDVAVKYAEKNIINKKNQKTILFVVPINYSYTLLEQIIKDSNVDLKIDKNFDVKSFSNTKDQKESNGHHHNVSKSTKEEKDFGKALNLFYAHPLGILYLAGVARACGFNVEILNLHKKFCEMIWNNKIEHESIQSFMYEKIKDIEKKLFLLSVKKFNI